MDNNLLNTDGSVTNYWWDCPSCGETKISSVLHDEDGNIKGATMCCPECFYVLKGDEKTYVDETVYEIPAELVPSLGQPRWKCQHCGGLNEKPSAQELQNLTVDDLYCQHCETWQCDIPGTPSYNPNAALERLKQAEKKSRFENPIIPVELKEDQQRFADTYQKTFARKILQTLNLDAVLKDSYHIKNILSRNNLIKFLVVFVLIFGVYDGLKIRSTEGLITNPTAEVTVKISQYKIVQKQGWNPNRSDRDYEEISASQKQSGTRQVPDGIETYWETEKYIDRYETEEYTETISEEVQTGTKTVKGECRTIRSGAVAKTECEPDRTAPIYSTETREVTRTREVPIYKTREVEKTRQKYRTEPVYDTWYVWKQGEWVTATTLSAFSNTFELQYPNTSKFENQPNFRIDSPTKDCRAIVEPKIKNLGNKEMKINCNLYETLSPGDSGTVLYRKWGGIKDVQL